jgi:fatty acid-binding protein 7
MALRKMASTLRPILELSKADDGHYLLTMKSVFKNTSVKFKLNEEVLEERFDGVKIKSIYRFDGENKLIQEAHEDPPALVVREFSEHECVLTATKGDVTCKRWFKALN